MIRFSLLLFLGTAAFGDDAAEKLNQIEKLVQEYGLDTKLNCSGIYGDLDSGYNECYPCDDERLKIYSRFTKLRLQSCTTSATLCCVSQKAIAVNRGLSSCGLMKKPAARRNSGKRASVRSVLVGEHPWRAWVHSISFLRSLTSSSDILCAATVVDENAEVVMTTASCVYGRDPRDLSISFSRTLDEVMDVAAVYINDKYKQGRPHVHDIALLRMSTERDRAPSWASPACLPDMAAMNATACITTSDNERFINTVIQLPQKCAESGVQVDAGQTCAVVPPHDYAPERGAALVCQDELRTGDLNYFVYGIALETNNSVTAYTDVFKYVKWIRSITS